jgi:hypothetical protein
LKKEGHRISDELFDKLVASLEDPSFVLQDVVMSVGHLMDVKRIGTIFDMLEEFEEEFEALYEYLLTDDFVDLRLDLFKFILTTYNDKIEDRAWRKLFWRLPIMEEPKAKIMLSLPNRVLHRYSDIVRWSIKREISKIDTHPLGLVVQAMPYLIKED